MRKTLEPFLPVPAVIRREDGSFGLDYDRPQTIGKVRAFTGPFGVFVRSYAFIRSYGPRLREMSEVAVLNANYLLARLKDAYDLPFDRHCPIRAQRANPQARARSTAPRRQAPRTRIHHDDLLPVTSRGR